MKKNLPQKLIYYLMRENLIDQTIANEWVFEYRKFLYLAFISTQPVSPSEQVDQVWHLHQTMTEHYRSFSFSIFGKWFKHVPSMGDH